MNPELTPQSLSVERKVWSPAMHASPSPAPKGLRLEVPHLQFRLFPNPHTTTAGMGWWNCQRWLHHPGQPLLCLKQSSASWCASLGLQNVECVCSLKDWQARGCDALCLRSIKQVFLLTPHPHPQQLCPAFPNRLTWLSSVLPSSAPGPQQLICPGSFFC